MDTCFECGGKLKLIAKHGRMVWDEDKLYEIPPELKISACVECGQPHVDKFVTGRLQKIIEAQRNVKPSQRLLYLRWIDNRLEEIFRRTLMWAVTIEALYSQVLTLLEFRELILTKGESKQDRKLIETMHSFMHKRWKIHALAFPKSEDVDLETEFAPAMKEFCDIWINATP